MSANDILMMVMGISFIVMIICFQIKTKQLSKKR